MARRLSPDIFTTLLSKRAGETEAPVEDENTWKEKVAEIVSEMRERIVNITPPDFMDRIDDEIMNALEKLGKPEKETEEETEEVEETE